MKGVISTGDKHSAKAGEWALRQGGNAYDAAISILLAAPLCELIFTNLGGGGFMLTQNPNQPPVLYDFFVDVPKFQNKELDFFGVDIDFGSAIQEFHIGLASAAVPGLVKGICQIHKDFASMPMSELIKPALKYAREGIYVSKYQADFVKLLAPIFTSSKSVREIYCKNGQTIKHTEPFFNHDYANFLEKFAIYKESIFYTGEVADKISQICEENGGLITKESLKNYKLKKLKPLKYNFGEYEIYLNPPPSVGGILIAFSLALLNGENLADFGENEFVKQFISMLEQTDIFRKKHINDFLYSPNLSSILKEKDIINAFRYDYNKRLNLLGNTTHLCVIDELENAISITSTNGEGCGVVVPESGILLNNMLGEEDLNPKGFFKWQDSIRLPSMMCPTMILKNKKLDLILGAAGSNRIRSAILNVALAYFKGKSIQEAINLPRAHLDKGVFYAEKGFMKELLKLEFEMKLFDEPNLFFGGVQAANSKLQGGADLRRGGFVLKV